MLVLGANLHLLKAVADVGGIEFIDGDRLGIIRFDGDDAHAAILVVGGQLGNTPLVHLCDRTMIAGEDHHHDGTSGIIGEPVYRSIDPKKFEIRCG